MSRDLTSGILSVIDNQQLKVFHLVTFYLSTEIRLTDHSHEINYDFGSGLETFQSTGRLAGSANITETVDISNPTINITITGANEADLLLPFTENYNDKQVIIRRGFFDTSGATADTNIIADPFIIFDGRVDSFSIQDNPTEGESNVTWNIASHWADWEKVSGRRCNNKNAQTFFPSEEGFSHCYDQIGGRTWGRVKTND